MLQVSAAAAAVVTGAATTIAVAAAATATEIMATIAALSLHELEHSRVTQFDGFRINSRPFGTSDVRNQRTVKVKELHFNSTQDACIHCKYPL